MKIGPRGRTCSGRGETDLVFVHDGPYSKYPLSQVPVPELRKFLQGYLFSSVPGCVTPLPPGFRDPDGPESCTRSEIGSRSVDDLWLSLVASSFPTEPSSTVLVSHGSGETTDRGRGDLVLHLTRLGCPSSVGTGGRVGTTRGWYLVTV